jgi:hypothetical protein
MPALEKAADPSDFELTHCVVPGEAGRDHVEEMAEAFVIEFKRMGWKDDAILNLFRNPFYAGLHYVYKERGEEFVVELLESVTKASRHSVFKPFCKND